MKKITLITLLLVINSAVFGGNRYWVASTSGDWSDAANWSDASGDPGGFSVPGVDDKVIFDANGIGTCNVDVQVDITQLTLKDDFSGSVNLGNESFTVNNDAFLIESGTFNGGSADITSVNNLIIDGGSFINTSGQLIIQKSLTISAGLFSNSGGTLVFNGIVDGVYKCDLSPSVEFENIIVDLLDGKEIKITAGDTLKAINKLTLIDGMLTDGDIMVQDTCYVQSGWDSGTSTLHFIGNGNSYYIFDNASWIENDLIVNKDNASDSTVFRDLDGDNYLLIGHKDHSISIESGIVSFDSGLLVDLNFNTLSIEAGGKFVASDNETQFAGSYTNNGGSFIHNDGLFKFNSIDDQTFTCSVRPADEFNEVELALVGKKFTITPGDTLYCLSDLQVAEVELIDGVIRAEGDVQFLANYKGGNTSVYFTGASQQEFGLAGDIDLFDGSISIDKTNDSEIIMTSALEMDETGQEIEFTQGYLVTSDVNTLTLGKATSVMGANDASFVSGPLTKFGDTEFEFPVGKNRFYAPLYISAPSNVAHSFTAEYFDTDTDEVYDINSLDGTIVNVSQCEYWKLDRTIGNSLVKIGLNWKNDRSCEVQDKVDLAVAYWDGTKWIGKGNGGTTGTLDSGSILSPLTLDSYGTFTFASVNPSKPLPVELISFRVVALEKDVKLYWATASETNNDHFEVQKSLDMENWSKIDYAEGAGNSSSLLEYSSIDSEPYDGDNYYRLKQVDFNGEFEYSDIEVVNYRALSFGEVVIYPNPTNGQLNIESVFIDPNEIRLVNILGSDKTSEIQFLDIRSNSLLLDISDLPKGIYQLYDGTNISKIYKN